jgi:HAE1 family hydrophobic/amphiphilic exporter-1
MGFTRLAIARPLLIWMALFAIAVLGLRAWSLLPSELNPRAEIPILMITTIYPGANSLKVESQVTKPMEEAVGTTPGVKEVSSSSQANVSVISVEFQSGTNIEAAISNVRSRIDALRSQLPEEASYPVVAKLDINARPVVQLGLSSKSTSLRELRGVIDSTLRPRLERVSGVASVQVVGGVQREVHVAVDSQRLAQYGVTIADVVNSLKAAGKDVPSGSVQRGQTTTSVRVAGAFVSLEQIRRTQILAPQLMQAQSLAKLQNMGASPSLPTPPLLVSDVATITDSQADKREINRVNGVEGIMIAVSRSSDSNTVQVADGVMSALEEMRASLPPDLSVVSLNNDATMVRSALEDVNVTLVLGSLLAMGVVLLFLHNLRGTLIVSIAIPACIVATFLVIWAAGFTLNQISLLALSLSVGILVDDSIVVLESITRHLGMGKEPRDAALSGRSEIGFADLTTTLVDVVVFVPIAFMGGIVGGFFKEFGLTIATATLLSLVVSFSVTPMLAARWYRKGEDVETKHGLFLLLERLYKRLEGWYRRLIRVALRRRGVVVLVGVGALVGVLAFALPRLGTEFMPGIDQGLITIDIETQPGTSLSATSLLAQKVEEALKGIPEIKATVTNVGQVVGGFGTIPKQGEEYAQVTLLLKDKRSMIGAIFGQKDTRTRSDEAVAEEMRKALLPLAKSSRARLATAAVRSIQGLQRGIQFQIEGQDMEALFHYAEAVRQKIADLPGVLDPQLSVRTGQPEISATVDSQRAAQYGVPINLAGSIVRDSLTGNTDTVFQEGNREYPIRIRLRDEERKSLTDIQNVVVGNDINAGNQPILLADIATITRQTAPANIERHNGSRSVMITANLTSEGALNDVAREFRKALEEVPHTGITYGEAGDAKAMMDNVPHFVFALGLAVILVYVVMASLFNSMGTPFVIMFTLPMALIGAFAALVLTGDTLSLVSGIGIIMLLGLMGRNAILLLDYTNTLRERGSDRTEALTEAGATRLRPILMTTTSTIVGMLPVALRIGEAAELRAPMAIVVIGGLLVSTVLTLVMIPVIYSLFDDIVRRRQKM